MRKAAPALARRTRASSAAVLASLLVLCLALAVPTRPAGASEVASCGFTSGALRNEVGASGPRVGAMQKGLAAVFSGRPAFDEDVRNGPLRDQLLGRRTRLWIGTFCDKFKPAFTIDRFNPGRTINRIATVEAALNHYAAIAMAHKNWREMVRGSALAAWLQASPPAAEHRLQLSGPAADVIDLLDTFAGLPPTLHDLGDAVTDYQEIEAAYPDWRRILASAPFINWVGADVGGLRALRRSGSAPIVIGLLADYAKSRPPTNVCDTTLPDDAPKDAVYYRLEAKDMATLAARASRLPALQALVGQTFDKKGDLVEAVAKALPALAAACPPDVFARIVTGPSGEDVVGTVLDAGSVDRLTVKNLPADLLGAISILEGHVFATREDLAEAVSFRIDEALLVPSVEAAAGPPPPTASPEPEAAMATRPPFKVRSEDATTLVARPVAAGEPDTEQAGWGSSRRGGYHGSDASAKGGRGGYECPDCTAVTPEQLGSIVEAAVSVYGLSAASASRLVRIGDAVPALAPLPEDRLADLASLQGVAFVNRRLFLRAVQTRLGIADPPAAADHAQLSAMAATARKQEPLPYPPVTITAEGCGCLRDLSGTIYGFLPPWLGADEATAAGAADTGQRAARAPTFAVDFTVLSRVGYLGLTLQADGKPAPDRQWQPSFDLGGFIATAHKHRTQVDLVVRAAGWQHWTDTVVQDVAVGHILDHVTRPIEPAATSVVGSLALDRFHSTRLDGVSLFFERFDGSAEQSRIINAIVTKLRAKLDAEDRRYFVNLVFDVDLSRKMLEHLRSILRSAPRPTSPTSFAESATQSIMPVAEATKGQADLVLLFLEQPSSKAKKRLRVELDESDVFHGQERKDLLRRIVPVISPAGHFQPQNEQNRNANSLQQLDDDLIYFKDNFAGVGFWPLPKRTSVDHERLRGQLVRIFATDVDGGFLQPSSDTGLAMQVCDFACPNRWLFRLATDAGGGLLVLAGLGASLSCRFRKAFGRYGLAILALALVFGCLVLISSVCDPFWRERRDLAGLGLIVLLAALLISRYIVALKRKHLP